MGWLSSVEATSGDQFSCVAVLLYQLKRGGLVGDNLLQFIQDLLSDLIWLQIW